MFCTLKAEHSNSN